MVTETLIARCIRQETKAQYELYRALYGTMMGICSRYATNREDAAATMNQGFLKVLQNLDSKRPEVPFEAWVRRILINTVIDEYRRTKDRRTHLSNAMPIEDHDMSQANDYLEQMESEAFAKLLEQVPEMSRKVFNLFAIDGFQHAEIADMLGISNGTSKWHVSHARGILKQALLARAIPVKSTIR